MDGLPAELRPSMEDGQAAKRLKSSNSVGHEFRRAGSVQYIPKEDDEKESDRLLPTNAFVNPLLTDLYQITMAYSYWKNNKCNDLAVFDLYFRKSPFKGEFCIFAGLEEVIRHVSSFRFKPHDLTALRHIMPHADPAFFDYLATLDCSQVKLYAMKEGTVCFPSVPLIRVEGPIGVTQLLETTLLNLVNFSSLVATNAARHKLAAGPGKIILEFGLRRAQGPDGGVSASRYTYIGGCDGTSNVLASSLFNIPVKGTHAHAFVSSFLEGEVLERPMLKHKNSEEKTDLRALAETVRQELGFVGSNSSELTAFVAYALAFPDGFLALVDTYDTLNSGVLNFLIVAVALHRLGYRALGIRLDSGDLAYFSREARAKFRALATKLGPEYAWLERCTIVASNDINENTLCSLNSQGHEIDQFGIGTHLVTCQAQPALGCVFKLVEFHGQPRIKLSNDIEKVTIPGRKEAYRLYGKTGQPIIDLLTDAHDQVPKADEKILCRHPFNSTKRCYVIPTKVEPLLFLAWDGPNGGVACPLPTIQEVRSYCQSSLDALRGDHKRILNPTPYKVSVTEHLYEFLHEIWQREAPVPNLD